MRRNVILTVCVPACAVAALIWIGTGHAQDPAQRDQQPMGQRPGEVKPGMVGNRMAGGNVDEKFLTECFSNSLFEIELGRMITGTARSNDVKQFAQQMIDAHTQKNQQLKELATKKNFQIPTQMEEWQRAKLAHVQRMQGPDLGTFYVIHEVGVNHMAMLWDQYTAKVKYRIVPYLY